MGFILSFNLSPFGVKAVGKYTCGPSIALMLTVSVSLQPASLVMVKTNVVFDWMVPDWMDEEQTLAEVSNWGESQPDEILVCN